MDNTSFDFYANYRIKQHNDADKKVMEEIDKLSNGKGSYKDFDDHYNKIKMLITSNDRFKDYARTGEGRYYDNKREKKVNRKENSGLKSILNSFSKELVTKIDETLFMNINDIDYTSLPPGSCFIRFFLELAGSFISRDDVPFYIIENPVRKDKVTGIPYTPATSWKGNLRWVMLKTQLETVVDDPEEFAKRRFIHSLLFGTEKGVEEQDRGWALYLDNLCPKAKSNYEESMEKKLCGDKHVAGMLYFYPTYWNKIRLEVINPHYRKVKTGKNPILYEEVPKGATGIFSLLYVPVHWYGVSPEELSEKSKSDLKIVIKGLESLMLEYGFSAKKGNNGIIESAWEKKDSVFILNNNEETFENFNELKKKVGILEDVINGLS